jgi:Uma2 family endonuclease
MRYAARQPRVLTADEFLVHPAARGHSELVRGEIHMMSPASGLHGLVAGNLYRLLSTHVHEHRLGACFPDGTGFALPNLEKTVRSPDASFVSSNRLPGESIDDRFIPCAPDLAVEVRSRSESASELKEKLDDYRTAAGILRAWLERRDRGAPNTGVAQSNGRIRAHVFEQESQQE